jgi:hypothetical protein
MLDAGRLLKLHVFVVQAVLKLPPDNVKIVPPLNGPFMGCIDVNRLSATGNVQRNT